MMKELLFNLIKKLQKEDLKFYFEDEKIKKLTEIKENIMNTKIKSLTNIKIIQKQDKYLHDYYIIFNNDSTNEAYFCWEKSIKIGWAEFQQNWANIKRIEFEYEELEKGNKVVNIITHDQSLDAFI